MQRLTSFMERNDITVARLEKASGIPSRTIIHLRTGNAPQLSSAAALLVAFSKLLSRPVSLDEIFDIQKLAADRKRQRRTAA